jgi:threonine dehydrogenase-like Zn-dependent dehydrogenase
MPTSRQTGDVKALVFERQEARYAAASVVSRMRPGAGAGIGPLHLADIDAPGLPNDEWTRIKPRLTGICGSDLSTIDGHSSGYFDDLVSFPFVPGHEVVGSTPDGERVVLEPVLGPEARGEEAGGEAPGDAEDYGYLLGGSIGDGIQIGFCSGTGGGWSEEFVAHKSQLHAVPESMSDETAVMLEPAAGGVHAAARAQIDGGVVLVIGAGTMGLATIAAIREYTNAETIVAVAKYPVQRSFAAELGADVVVSPSETARAIRRITGCRMIGDHLAGGADVTVDAIGNAASIEQAIGVTRPRGRVMMVGMPGKVSLDLTALWHRETELLGAYTYGTDVWPDGTAVSSFTRATELAEKADLGRLVSAKYPLSRYQDAIAHAAQAGQRGAIKVVFEQ